MSAAGDRLRAMAEEADKRDRATWQEWRCSRWLFSGRFKRVKNDVYEWDYDKKEWELSIGNYGPCSVCEKLK